MNNIRDYTEGFRDFLENKFGKQNINLGLHNLIDGMPTVAGYGSDTAVIGVYSYGVGANRKSVEFSFCFYTPRKTKDARMRVHFNASEELQTDALDETGLLKMIKKDGKNNDYTLEYKFVKDPQQISPDTLYGDFWASVFKKVFLQMQSTP